MEFAEALEIVVNPYGNKDSANRKGLIVKGEWRNSYLGFAKENAIDALYLNSALGFKGNDFSFLRKIPWLKELNIIVGNANNLEVIGGMHELEELSITCHSRSTISGAGLSRLEKLYVYWWPGAIGLIECERLRSIYLDKIDPKNTLGICHLRYLKELTIANSEISEIDFISCFALNKLEFLNCKKIVSYAPIREQSELNWLAIRGCANVNRLDFLPHPSVLEVLLLSDAGPINTLDPIREQVHLKAFAFDGNTSVADFDLGPLLCLNELSMLMFKQRKEYSYKLIKKWNWSDFGYPDKLLVMK